MTEPDQTYHLIPAKGQPHDNHYNASTVQEVPGVVMIQILWLRPAQEEKKLEDHVREEGWNNLIVDLASISYIDTWTLQEIIGAYTIAKNANGEVKLSGMNEKIRKSFETTSLIDFFEIYNTVEDAIASYSLPKPTSYK